MSNQVRSPRYISVKEVAEMFSVSASTIWRWVKAETFPAPKKMGIKITRWDMHEVSGWVNQQDHSPIKIN